MSANSGWAGIPCVSSILADRHGADRRKLELSGENSRAYDWETANHEHEDLVAVYAAMIGMDQNIGRLMKAIRANKGGDNTLVLFLSDNGCAEEPGERSPKIVPGPKEFYGSGRPGVGRNHRFAATKAGRTRRHAHAVHRLVAGPSAARGITRRSGISSTSLPTFLDLGAGGYPKSSRGTKSFRSRARVS